MGTAALVVLMAGCFLMATSSAIMLTGEVNALRRKAARRAAVVAALLVAIGVAGVLAN